MGRLRLIVLPGVLRPPSDAALLAGVMARDAAWLAGRDARSRVDYLRSSGVVDASLRERMVVVEGRAPLAPPLRASVA